jgi:uncharacterized LabA/DUF88 family protein
MAKKQDRLAVLIDADNAQAAIIEGLIAEIAKYGIASVKRIYGDWTDNRLKRWKAVLLEYGMTPIQQFAYSQGKNATDAAMIIDAMDLLYSGEFEGFCIVSSDSDFTKLASRLRESGMTVYGFGERKTPKAFLSTCDKFIYTENLRNCVKQEECDEEFPLKATESDSKKSIKDDKKLLALLARTVDDCMDETMWANLGTIGRHIAKTHPDFDPRTYGFKKLSDLLVATEAYEVKTRFADEHSSHKTMLVRPKSSKRK